MNKLTSNIEDKSVPASMATIVTGGTTGDRQGVKRQLEEEGCVYKYKKPHIDARSIDISRINSEIEIAIQSHSMMLSDKLKISLVLIERMTINTVKLIKSKIHSIGVLNDVVIKLLNEAREVSLNEPKRMFLALSIGPNSTILSFMLRKTIETYPSSLPLFVENTLNCATVEYVGILLESNYESLIFNLMRKTILSEIREYIHDNINSISDSGIKMLIKKEYLKKVSSC